MFKLKRLQITGFKSFADHTELVFTGEGITAVVGPNGCGKSNVSDAISWVLGEQRVKQLRGGEMKDVIFQGSRNRQPSGMAEVVLQMVRDESVEDEQDSDIEDIDSTLEDIDEHTVVLEDAAPQVQAGAEAETIVLTGTELAADAEGVVNAALTTELQSDSAAKTDGLVAADGTETVGNPTETPHKTHPHGKRHWRRTRLALEFAPGETVSVTRRLYRSGESEYLLNNKICRLRDIQDLFSGTGLSGGHYAIIEQGRIGQILSAKPMDRRTLIEEAAGITKFRVRQRAAEARLESARGNLSRVSDIISEIDRQVNSLRRQASKARRYRILREELRELLRDVYVAEESALSLLLDETRDQLEIAVNEEQSIAAEITEREEQARGATQEARAIEEELSAARAAAAEATLHRDRREREKTYQQEQAESLDRRRTEVSSEIENLKERLQNVDHECVRLRELEEELRLLSDESAERLQAAEKSYADSIARVRVAEENIERSRSELLTHTAVSERLREITRQLESTLERLASQADGLAREGERAASVHAERKLEAEQLQAEIESARAKLELLTSERQEALEVVSESRRIASEAGASLSKARDAASRQKHRLDSLLDLDSQRAHFTEAVQALFSDDAASEDFSIHGTLADQLRVDARWEAAVEGILGSALQSIIVPTPEDAIRASAWLRNNDVGRATFLVAGFQGGSDEDVQYSHPTGESGQAVGLMAEDDLNGVRVADILGIPRELKSVLNRAMSDRVNARMADSLEDAVALSLRTGEVCVALTGDWVAGGNFIQAGQTKALDEGAGLLSFKRELRELETRVAELEAEATSAKEIAEAAGSRLSEAEDVVVSLNEIIGREERDMMGRELNATQLEQEIERAARHMRVVADDAARLEQERLEVTERMAKAVSEAETAEGLRQSASEQVALAAENLAEARRLAELESESLGVQRGETATAAERRRSATAELRRMETERVDLESRLERHGIEVENAATRLEELRRSIGEIEKITLSAEEERLLDEQKINDVATRLAEAREQADRLAAMLADLNHDAAAIREQRASLEVRRAEATARIGFVRESCMSELNQSLEDLARERPVSSEFNLEEGRARVEEMRERVEGFGAVNMMALEELSEAEQRLEFLTAQRQDIVDGIKSTEEALREIKRRSRERFRHAFEVINRNFGELFQELFGGGRGEMSMIDADDVLESGIDIVAQPPGKRLQNVLLLSGGEKAMAALSLVLAIFRYRPSPFCLLDEVDAPLDEANVGRFINKIGEMATSTQFIVITHNKRTMEMARALYGVTMEDAGISKLVSVRFE